jgi:hypothetical protein
MILRKVIPGLIVFSCLFSLGAAQEVFPRPSTTPPSSTVDHTQDFSEIVVPITSVKLTPSIETHITTKPGPKLDLNANFGTGFCLDAACRFIVTNYHVAATTRTDKIKHEKIIHRYFATGPSDHEATANLLPNDDLLLYAKKRDLAIFELRHSLPHHHGLTFSLDELEVGQEVDIYGYPKGSINPIRKLTRFPATFKGPTTSGLLAFEYRLSGDKPIRLGGASGGIVVDSRTEKILGILCGGNETMAAAVPVQTLAEFVNKVQPFLAQRVFPATTGVSPLPADLYSKFAPLSDHNPKFLPVHSEELQHRPEEPPEVKVLRIKAQLLADSMRNFMAVQSYEWGSGDKESSAEAAYEVRVIDGIQRFRSYPDGKKQLDNASRPHLNGSIRPADEWSKLPKMVATEWRLKVHQAADVVVNKQRMKVFQYYASVEDDLCPLEPTEDFGLFTISLIVAVACYGEVWTDEDTNIIRISEHLELSNKLKAYRGWVECQVVLTYGWLKQTDELPRLIPVTIYTQAVHGKKLYWCRGQFTDYRRFGSEVKIIANSGSRIP